MSLTHTLGFTVSGGAGAGISASVSVSSDGESNRDISYLASNDQLIAFALDVSQCKSVFIMATTNSTLETNSSSAPDRTLTLIANEPIVWYSTLDTDIANPFSSTDVTALYISAASAGTLYIRCILDSTL